MAGKIVLAYVHTIRTWYRDDTHPHQCITVYFIWYQLHFTVNPYFFYFYRFLNCSPKWTDDMKNQIDELITNYIKHPTKFQETNSIITLQEEFLFSGNKTIYTSDRCHEMSWHQRLQEVSLYKFILMSWS